MTIADACKALGIDKDTTYAEVAEKARGGVVFVEREDGNDFNKQRDTMTEQDKIIQAIDNLTHGSTHPYVRVWDTKKEVWRSINSYTKNFSDGLTDELFNYELRATDGACVPCEQCTLEEPWTTEKRLGIFEHRLNVLENAVFAYNNGRDVRI